MLVYKVQWLKTDFHCFSDPKICTKSILQSLSYFSTLLHNDADVECTWFSWWNNDS